MDDPLTFAPLAQPGQSWEAATLRDQANPSGFSILKFIKRDWYLVLIGVFLYGVIGVGYPIYGAVIAHVSAVSSVCACSFLHDLHYKVYFRYSVKVTRIHFFNCLKKVLLD